MSTPKSVTPETLALFGRNLEAYAKVCLQIRTKGAEMKPLEFNDEQRIINEMLREQYKRTGRVRAVILKARQIGMSTYTSARFFRKMHLWPNQKAVVIADELERTEELFLMYDRYATYLPPEIKPMVRYATKKRELFFDNPNERERFQRPGLGSGISVETAGDAAAGRGATVQLAHMSEMATWPANIAVDVFVSLAQAVPDEGSEIIVESTANGVGNLFHQMWKEAEEGQGEVEGSNGYLAIFFPWWTHKPYQLALKRGERKMITETLDQTERQYIEEGIEWRGEHHKLTLEQIAWRRRTIREKCRQDPRIFRQEYPSTPDEAFLVSGGAFFDEEALEAYGNKTVRPKRRTVLVSPPAGNGVLMQKAEQGWLRIWEQPVGRDITDPTASGHSYIIGVDTSQGKLVSKSNRTLTDPEDERGGRDFSSADVLDVQGRAQVAQLHARVAPDVLAHQLYLLGHLYSTELPNGLRRPALIVVERNHSSGEAVIEWLQKGQPGRHGPYSNLYVQRRHGRRGSSAPRKDAFVGWLTTVETRGPMLDNLRAMLRQGFEAMRDGRDDYFRIPCSESIGEMLTFVIDDMGKPQAQEGSHDDRVISLAIAAYVMNNGMWHIPKNVTKERKVLVGSSPTGLYDY